MRRQDGGDDQAPLFRRAHPMRWRRLFGIQADRIGWSGVEFSRAFEGGVDRMSPKGDAIRLESPQAVREPGW